MTVKVKICGVRSVDDARAAVAAGADFIGLNFHPPSPRHVDVEPRRAIAAAVPGTPLVGVFVDAPRARRRATSPAASGSRRCSSTATRRPAYCRGWPSADHQGAPRRARRRRSPRGAPLRHRLPAARQLRRRAAGRHRASRSTRRSPRGLPAGAALRRRRAPAGDGGRRRARAPAVRGRRRVGRRARPGVKDHAQDRATSSAAPKLPDARRGTSATYGGRYVAETLMPALARARARVGAAARATRAFRRELARLARATTPGRPTRLYFARRLSERLGGARIYLKREDLLPHRRAQDQQHDRPGAARARGSASGGSSPRPAPGSTASRPRPWRRSSACACEIFMGAEDVRRQSLNVFRMKLLGAEVHVVESGTQHAQGRDERGAARLDRDRRATRST